MPTLDVSSQHPIQVSATEGEEITVKNLSATAVAYKQDPSVSFSNKTGELTESQELTLGQNETTWFIAKESAKTGETPKEVFASAMLEIKHPSAASSFKLPPESVNTADLGKEAVTTGKIASSAVTPAKIKAPTTPVASGTESLTAELGTSGGTRTVIAVYNAKHEASAKVKIKHGLATEYLHVSAWKASSKKATEKITDGAAVAGAISKVAYVSAEEIELTLVATEPAAKEELFYVISG